MRICFAFTLVGTTLFLASAHAQPSEYEVKAAFLYNFARYVEWPRASFAGDNSPVAICVLGPSPFAGALERVTAGKTVSGRAFVIREWSDSAPGDRCHILFVPSAARKPFRSLPPALKSSGVLTVGEAEGFAADGGVLNFILEDGKIRFEINPQAAAREQLRISSRLLSLARITPNKDAAR